MPTIKQIAELAGVSRGTVDRVLNRRGSVRPETERKILAIAESLHYSPNLAGKTLAVKKKQLKFGYILHNPKSNPFFAEVARGIHTRAEELLELGVQVELRYTGIDDPASQIQQINELAALGIDGLVLVPINHPDITRRLQKLTEAGIPVVTANSDLPGCGRIAYVGSDYNKSGRTAAGLMRLFTGGSATVGIVLGSSLLLCHSERVAGFAACLREGAPGIKVADETINHDDDTDSFCVTKEMLLEHPEIDALFLASAGVSGACRAVQELGRTERMRIICYDLVPQTRLLLEQGIVTAVIDQQPLVQGIKPLDLLLDAVGLGILPDREYFYTEIGIKIRENLEPYDEAGH